MKYTLTFAILASITGSAFAALRAPLPEFKNEKQLAEWRAEKASESSTRSSTQDTAFYTGKPYLASSGSYAFKYRGYNPEMARWTSEDPSGFSDGANGNVYAPCPTSAFDFEGLKAKGAFDSQVYTISLSVLVYDPTSAFTQSTISSWTTSVNSAWTYSGTDKSNDQNLNLHINVTFTLQTSGYYREADALATYDNVITFGGSRARVRDFRVGFFPMNVDIATLIHETGHFMNVADAYNDVYTNGILTGGRAMPNWEGTVMACEASQATKKDANAVIFANGEKIHLFE